MKTVRQINWFYSLSYLLLAHFFPNLQQHYEQQFSEPIEGY